MIHGRTRLEAGAGFPGDPGGFTPPGGGGGNPPNPPIDPTTRGPDDPGGGGGPVDVIGDGSILCSRIHTVSIQNLPDGLSPNAMRFQGVWTLIYAGGNWSCAIPNDGSQEVLGITLSGSESGGWFVNGNNSSVPTAAFEFQSNIMTKCPGQSVYPMNPPTQRGMGEYAGTTCSVG